MADEEQGKLVPKNKPRMTTTIPESERLIAQRGLACPLPAEPSPVSPSAAGALRRDPRISGIKRAAGTAAVYFP